MGVYFNCVKALFGLFWTLFMIANLITLIFCLWKVLMISNEMDLIQEQFDTLANGTDNMEARTNYENLQFAKNMFRVGDEKKYKVSVMKIDDMFSVKCTEIGANEGVTEVSLCQSLKGEFIRVWGKELKEEDKKGRWIGQILEMEMVTTGLDPEGYMDSVEITFLIPFLRGSGPRKVSVLSALPETSAKETAAWCLCVDKDSSKTGLQCRQSLSTLAQMIVQDVPSSSICKYENEYIPSNAVGRFTVSMTFKMTIEDLHHYSSLMNAAFVHGVGVVVWIVLAFLEAILILFLNYVELFAKERVFKRKNKPEDKATLKEKDEEGKAFLV